MMLIFLPNFRKKESSAMIVRYPPWHMAGVSWPRSLFSAGGWALGTNGYKQFVCLSSGYSYNNNCVHLTQAGGLSKGSLTLIID